MLCFSAQQLHIPALGGRLNHLNAEINTEISFLLVQEYLARRLQPARGHAATLIYMWLYPC